MTLDKLKRQKMMRFFVESKMDRDTITKMINEAKKENAFIILHQDAFCADYQDEEFFLLGNYIKYIGEHGIEIRIIGKNRETLK
jgi:ATP adenylyltransferase/5',5'''-P-1,P-4-tetraphosphate phosphorylase II